MANWLEEALFLLDWQRELGGAFLPLGGGCGKARVDKPRLSSGGNVHVPASAVTVDLFGGPVSGDVPMNQTPYERIKALIPEDSPLCAMDSLEEIAEWVRRTRLVQIDDDRQNAVPGVGNPDADLMLVGEAPGADEDRQGEPFVGRAGQLLNQILKAIDFERSDVFIGNILKSRPPNNRDPKPEEVEAHIPILFRQISLIRPKLILCLGRVAATSLLNTTQSLGKMRGKAQDFHGLEVYVTYHPAALLRNPHWKRPTWEDVQLVRRRYDELTGQRQQN